MSLSNLNLGASSVTREVKIITFTAKTGCVKSEIFIYVIK
jgi:hypothetical protein